MEYNENSYYPGQNPGDGQPKRKKPQNRGLWKLLWLVPVILIIAGLAMDSFYTLTEDQYAVITTFGKPTTVSASGCLLYTSPSPRDRQKSRMPSSA